MPSPGTLNREQAGLRLGSFWNESIAAEAKDSVDALLDIAPNLNVYRQFENTRALLNGGLSETVQDLWVSFSPKAVTPLGGDLQLRIISAVNGITLGGQLITYGNTPVTFGAQTSTPVYVTYRPSDYAQDVRANYTSDENNFTLQGEDGVFIIWPDTTTNQVSLTTADLYPRYMVPFPNELDPQSILAQRVLVAGLDFVKADGCLIFWESPEVLFPNYRMLVLNAKRLHRNIASYTLQLDDLFSPGYYVANYLRNIQSVQSFKLAVAETAGAVIIPWTATLQSTKVYGAETQYTFDQGMLRVRYPHAPLVAGNVYEKDTIIGNVVKVYGNNGASNWYRQVDWSNGLSLDGLCPFTGLSVQDNTVNNNQVHPFQVQGSPALVDKFWNYVSQASALCGHSLTDIQNLGQVNPIDFFFQYIWGERALLVRLDSALGQNGIRQAQDFISREKPVGSVIIYP